MIGKYNVGDRVIVRTDLEMDDKKFPGLCESMMHYKGSVLKVIDKIIWPRDVFYILDTEYNLWWHKNCLNKIE